MGNIIKDPFSNDPYLRNGYPSRRAYLAELAESYGLPYSAVKQLADTMGENEDFDGLVSLLDDMPFKA